MSLAWHDGRLVEDGEPALRPDDGGFLHGDGLFETFRVEGGRALDPEAHLDRLLEGAKRIGLALPEDRSVLRKALAAVAGAAPGPVARMRLTVSRGSGGRPPTRLIVASVYAPPPEEAYRDGVTVLLAPKPRLFSRSPLAGLKSISYQVQRLARLEAEEKQAREMLLLNEEGRVVEGSHTNVISVRQGRPLTPPLADGALPGTVRRRLIEAKALEEGPLKPEALFAAEEILLTNSLVGVLPVGSLNGRAVRVGPHGARLRWTWEKAIGAG